MRGFYLAVLAAALACVFAATAGADTVGPVTFEQGQGYTVGTINGQNGWSDTGGFDAAVVGLGDGTQALRISDAVTSGSFGDQTFSPGLVTPAHEGSVNGFDASFSIGMTSPDVQPGLHLSVSPDDGTGSRMSYLRFEDESDGIHVFFDDATDPGPVGTPANFTDTEIATLDRGTTHTVHFAIRLVPGPANDVVTVTIDNTYSHTGTTWEDYYRYDPEQLGNGNAVPSIDKLLFREAGDANPADAGHGFLIDNVSLSSAKCLPTGFNGLTAAQIGGDVTGALDATGCDIGLYNGSVHGGEVYGAQSYGVVADDASGDVINGAIHDIGDKPFDGVQRGIDVYYTNGANGTVSGSTITRYQKGGIVIKAGSSVSVLDNTVTGQGPIDYIAQNGIQVSSGATALIKGNTVSGNWYTPKSYVACGLLFFDAGGVKQQGNTLFGNEINLCNVGRGGGNTSAG